MAEVQSQEAPKITLYWLDQSRAQRIIWLLEELHLPYNIQIFHRNKDFLAPPELEKVHPLGKSPVISITPPNRPGENLTEEQRRVVIAESGWMTQYLIEHFPEHGSKLVPKRWKDGMEGQIGGETEAWMRYSYYLHYTEGSFMPILVMGLVISRLKGSDVPFIVRPITSIVADRIFSIFLFPGAKKHLAMLEEHLSTSGGRYLCGDTLTAADILMSFPLVAAKDRLDDFGRWDSPDRKWATQFPKVKAYVDLMNSEPGYQRSVEKIKELDGGKFEMYENV